MSSQNRKVKRLRSTPKQIEIYNKIQNRYTNLFNMCSVQPLEVLDELKNKPMSKTDREAFNAAYRIVESAKKIKDAEQ